MSAQWLFLELPLLKSRFLALPPLPGVTPATLANTVLPGTALPGPALPGVTLLDLPFLARPCLGLVCSIKTGGGERSDGLVLVGFQWAHCALTVLLMRL